MHQKAKFAPPFIKPTPNSQPHAQTAHHALTRAQTAQILKFYFKITILTPSAFNATPLFKVTSATQIFICQTTQILKSYF